MDEYRPWFFVYVSTLPETRTGFTFVAPVPPGLSRYLNEFQCVVSSPTVPECESRRKERGDQKKRGSRKLMVGFLEPGVTRRMSKGPTNEFRYS